MPIKDTETESDESDQEPGETQSSQSRYWLTNDAIALLLVIGFVGTLWLHGFGVIDLSTLPADALLAFLVYVGVAVTWAFGTDAVRAWKGK